jgi:hypothetical protein
MGWPIVGEALAFAADPFTFVSARVAAHGPVLQTRLFNKRLAILAGPDAATAFLDEANVRRAGGLPPHAAALFGAPLALPGTPPLSRAALQRRDAGPLRGPRRRPAQGTDR